MTATSWEPGQRHARPDPNVCPHCGAGSETDVVLRELADRHCWQPVKLDYERDADGVALEDTQLVGVEYEEFDYADAAVVTGFDCRECGWEWESLGALAFDQRVVKALTDHADYAYERLYDVGVQAAYQQALAIVKGNGEA